MDKYELADEYISKVKADYHPHLGSGTALLSLALLRACADLIAVRDEYDKYKKGVLQERKEDLARALGIDLGLLDKVNFVVSERWPQDAAGAEQTPSRPDPQGTPVAAQEQRASLDPDAFAQLLDSVSPPDSPVHCPNCGELAALVQVLSEATYMNLIECGECDYKEVR